MAEQLRIPSAWLVFLVFHIVEVIHCIVDLPKEVQACEAVADPLGAQGLLLEMLDLSRFWHGIDGGLADKWSNGSKPCLSLLPGGQQHLAKLALLQLQRKVLLGECCGASHLAARLKPHRP